VEGAWGRQDARWRPGGGGGAPVEATRRCGGGRLAGLGGGKAPVGSLGGARCGGKAQVEVGAVWARRTSKADAVAWLRQGAR
jgi:hypothetical protein